MGNYKKSNEYLTQLISVNDSLLTENTLNLQNKLQSKYESEKKDSEIALLNAEKEKNAAITLAEQKKKNIIIFSTAIGLIIVIIFSLFLYKRFKITYRQKQIIEEQKQVVDEKNKEITDSIQYAKRIQNAILPPAKVVKEYLRESFILYKPKDIVAGDFYWLEQKDNKVLFAAADCTGHGVPGAMVSVVCNNGLNRSVREYGLTDPGEILNKTREIVVQEFEKSEDEVKDGMDIALCSLRFKVPSSRTTSNQETVALLQYAGAHNPLWLVRNRELIETKANKQPVGKFDNPEPYTTHNVELKKGDSIYIFSDGYANQFSEAVISPDKIDSMLTQVFVRRRTSDLARYGFHWGNDNTLPSWSIKYDGVPTAQTRILASLPDTNPPTPGDTIRIEVVTDATTGYPEIKAYHNGVLKLTAIDSATTAILNGEPGMAFRFRINFPSSYPAKAFEEWSGGDITPIITNITPNKPISEWLLYPNPFSDNAILSFKNMLNANYTLFIYNVNGQLVREIKNINSNKVTINREELTKGVYFFQLRLNQEILLSDKFILD